MNLSPKITEKEDNLETNTCCGEIQSERGIQRLEAMLYAIDLINSDDKLLKNLKIGAKIYDTCDQDTIALDKSMNFVTSVENLAENLNCNSKQQNCSNYKHQFENYESIIKNKVVGVVGAASSLVSMQVAHFLRLFKVS